MNKIMITNKVLVLMTVSFVSFFTMYDSWQQSFAEELSPEVAIKRYQPKIDQAVNERLSPLKQIDIGVRGYDVICFDEKVRILKWSASLAVACVNQDTATKLQIRDWGVIQIDESKFNKEPPVGFTQFYWKAHLSNNTNHDLVNNLDKTLIKHMRKSIHSVAESTAWMPIQILDKKNDTVLVTTGAANINDQEIQIIADSVEKNPLVIRIDFFSKLSV